MKHPNAFETSKCHDTVFLCRSKKKSKVVNVMLEVLIEENRSRQSKEMIVYCGSQHSCSSGDGSRSWTKSSRVCTVMSRPKLEVHTMMCTILVTSYLQDIREEYTIWIEYCAWIEKKIKKETVFDLSYFLSFFWCLFWFLCVLIYVVI